MTTLRISKLCINSSDQRFAEKYECLVTMATGFLPCCLCVCAMMLVTVGIVFWRMVALTNEEVLRKSVCLLVVITVRLFVILISFYVYRVWEMGLSCCWM